MFVFAKKKNPLKKMDAYNFVISFLFGISVLFCYGYFLPKSKYAWGNIKKTSIKSLYFISIFLSAISYLVVWVYQVFYKEPSLLYSYGNTIFLIGALLWPIVLYFAPTRFHTVILTLSITSLGALLILLDQCLHPGTIKIIFALYLFLHVFVLDNIFWSISYRSLFLRNDPNGW